MQQKQKALQEKKKKLDAATSATDEVLYRALEQGLSFKTTMGNVLTLTPPLIVTAEQMDAELRIVEDCIAEVGKGRPFAREP